MPGEKAQQVVLVTGGTGLVGQAVREVGAGEQYPAASTAGR